LLSWIRMILLVRKRRSSRNSRSTRRLSSRLVASLF
jgi:hypothetical protein